MCEKYWSVEWFIKRNVVKKKKKNIIKCSNENQLIDTNAFKYDENLEKLDKPEKITI